MERAELIAMMGELKLAGMRAAYDEVLREALKRELSYQEMLARLLQAELAEKRARSIRYRLGIAKLPLSKELADLTRQLRDLGLILVQRRGCFGLGVELAGLNLLDPEPDQVAGDVVALGKAVQALSLQVGLGDLVLEVDAVTAVTAHGPSPEKAAYGGSKTCSRRVRREGCTPIRGHGSMPIDSTRCLLEVAALHRRLVANKLVQKKAQLFELFAPLETSAGFRRSSWDCACLVL